MVKCKYTERASNNWNSSLGTTLITCKYFDVVGKFEWASGNRNKSCQGRRNKKKERNSWKDYIEGVAAARCKILVDSSQFSSCSILLIKWM